MSTKTRKLVAAGYVPRKLSAILRVRAEKVARRGK
jgi:hypothetical protein